MPLKLMALVIAVVRMVSAQDRGGILNQAENGDTQSVITTPKTTAFLSCESGDMVVKVNFTQPFKGLMYAHSSRNSPCRMHGTGGYYYELRIPLKGCGTWQESPRVFINNITIRFHPALELEDDETKTLVCRYPPPLTPPPGNVQVIEPPPNIIPTSTPTRVGTARLSEIEILIIICVLLFLSLLILGIGIAYFCLKRRNIHIVRKSTIAASSSPPSQITRLSGSNLYPPSSLLSSILGHTVRIPRAVPYSAPAGRVSALSSPEHHYEDYPASSSTTETNSGEISETSVSSSSLVEDQVDASKHLLYKKGFPKSILSIPKAILRKSGAKRWQTEPTVHQYHLTSSTSANTSVKKPEMEDQTVTTMLEPENNFEDDVYWSGRQTASKSNLNVSKLPLQQKETQTEVSSIQTPVPVYAQVHKLKKLPQTIREEPLRAVDNAKGSTRPAVIPSATRRQRQVLETTPEECVTTEEVTKNTTVVTSVRREIAETRILSPILKTSKQEAIDAGCQSDGSLDAELHFDGNKSETSTLISNVPKSDIQKEPKSVLIRDVADIYLTTTVETESRELTTVVSRDYVEQHARTEEKLSQTKLQSDENATVEQNKTPVTNWNVVIRQKPPQSPMPVSETDLDDSSENNSQSIDERPSEQKPSFDVKIRTIPPNQLKPKTSPEIISIPPLEMPETIGKLKEALIPKKIDVIDSPVLSKEMTSESDKTAPVDSEKSSFPQRTVRWMDDIKASRDSTVSSSDSFQSAESLRERSSSEVLEVAPTLPSQQNISHNNRPVLERSTSEMESSDQVRWVGGVVPVLESLSPEFLANIPVVIQGGFFNKQRNSSQESKE